VGLRLLPMRRGKERPEPEEGRICVPESSQVR
jgi:hypothetical protein